MKKFFQAINRFFEVAGMNRAARELEQLSDRQLKDLGILRTKLEKGAAAYPWREEESSLVYAKFQQPKKETAFAVEESVAA